MKQHILENFELSYRIENEEWTDITQVEHPYSHGNSKDLAFHDEAVDLVLLPITFGEGFVLEVKGLLKEKKPLFGKQSFFHHKGAIKLKMPIHCEDYLAIYQHKHWWTRPFFGKSIDELPQKSQLILWKSKESYSLFLVSTSEHYRCDMSGGDDGIQIVLSSNSYQLREVLAPIFCYYVGSNPYELITKAVQALSHYSPRCKLREDKSYPEIFNHLGWCSWDAFYHKVNQKELGTKMSEFVEKSIPVSWVLIDDGWLSADYEHQQLTDLDARTNHFPEGLSGAIKDIYNTLRKKIWVGVWHASMGYWNGIKPGSPASKALAQYSRILPDGRIIPDLEYSKSFGFWDIWHSELAKSGIQFLKVDGQSAVSLFNWGSIDYGESQQAFHKALEASCHNHFDDNMINCMGMAPENVWHRCSAISRSSDDFVPEDPNSFSEHALQNTYNSLWIGQFEWTDWDMFWTMHPDALRHAALRAVSGGPIYISDRIDKTDIDVLKPLMLQNGRILRCTGKPAPSLDCLLKSPEDNTYLSVWNSYGDFRLAVSFAWNDKPCEFILDGKNYGLNGEVLAYAFVQQTIMQLPQVIKMNREEYIIFLLWERSDSIHILGLKEKYLSPATIMHQIKTSNGIYCKLAEPGTLVFYSEKEPGTIHCNGQTLNLLRGDNKYLYYVDIPNQYSEPDIFIDLTI